uniref:cathelicidin-3-like n=1 Tax=Euleptes europaea TaxID=460621 RepID=UPI0025408C46|nr:cathelicidin-3-like [Euleptes europaea]
MANCWATLLLMVGVAIAIPTVPPQLSYDQALASAVKTYNQESGLESIFRLLEAEPKQNWDPTTGNLQQLTFTMQETTCPNSENVVTEQCEFKPDGLIKGCTGYFSTEPGNPKILVSCENAVQKPVRVTRFRGLGLLLRGLGRGFGRLWGSNQ